MRPPSHPGTAFLRAAAHLFDAAVVERVFTPAVADLQAEWHATSGQFDRVRVRVRGELSLIVLAMVTPFQVRTSLNAGEAAPVRPSAGGWFLLVLASPHATAEINLSAIPVEGDVAGLMFALGSVSIVVIGLPGMSWYLLGVVLGSTIAAVSLRAWHTRSRNAHQDGLLHLR